MIFMGELFVLLLTFSLIIGVGYLLYKIENRTDDSAKEIGGDKKMVKNGLTLKTSKLVLLQ